VRPIRSTMIQRKFRDRVIVVHDRSLRLRARKGGTRKRRGSVSELRRGSAQDRVEDMVETTVQGDVATEAQVTHGTLLDRLSMPIDGEIEIQVAQLCQGG
jgi:hypothetical protein